MQKFNVLSLTGGGYMGLYTAMVLAGIERRHGRPLGESFDLVVGTSIGGILALAVAQGVELDRVVHSFLKNGELIFSTRATPKTTMERAWDTLRFLSGSKYESENLRLAIEEFLDPAAKMRDLKKRAAIASVNLTRGIPHTFRTSHSEVNSNSADVSCVDVALATSAAPTLLPIHRIGREYFSDGGTYANSPDLVALHEAETVCGADPEGIQILSIGTTSGVYEFPEPRTASFGLKEWAEGQRIVKMVLATQQSHASRIVHGRLGDRYLRIDEAQSGKEALHTGLDVADSAARAILRRLADRTLQDEARMALVDARMDHDAPVVSQWFHENGVQPTIY